MDGIDEMDANRTVSTSSSDFPQIQFPDMPLDDLYVGQYIAKAETNMKKKTQKDLEEIRDKAQFLCDFCILIYEDKIVPKSEVEKNNLAAQYHNPVEQMNLCSDCYKVLSEEEKQDFCKLSIATCNTDDDTEEYMAFLRDVHSRLGIDTSD